MDTLADLEQLWAALPPAAHAAWSQRARGVLLDGSPQWEVMRTCPVLPDSDVPASAAAAAAAGQPAAAAPATVPAVVNPEPSPPMPLRVPRGVNPWKKSGPLPVRRPACRCGRAIATLRPCIRNIAHQAMRLPALAEAAAIGVLDRRCQRPTRTSQSCLVDSSCRRRTRRTGQTLPTRCSTGRVTP